MYRAGTGVQGDVIAEDRRHVKAHKRMGKAQQFQLRAFNGAENGVFSRANTLHDAFNQIFRQNHRLAVNLHQRIIKVRRQGNRAVSWQSPRRGGPDNQRHRAAHARQTKLRFHRILIDGAERHVDRR